jgi:Tol biopolymer transport system component
MAYTFSGCVERRESPELGIAGEYFGQAPPGMEPQLFAPDIISTGLNERDAAFSPDGREFYYTVWLPMRSGVIMEMHRKNSHWSQPDIAPFSGEYSDLEPFIAPDGKVLLFVSNRPLEGEGQSKDYDIWFVHRTDSGWSDAYNFGSPINSSGNEFYPSATEDGTIYFTCDTGSSEDIYFARLIDGAYAEPQKLGEAINTDRHEFNSVIAPDESFLIFSSMQREDGLGRGDLYISFRRDDGSWTKARNMGEEINTGYTDYCPAFSPDGKYLFFTSNRVSAELDSTRLTSLDEMRRLHDRYQNGNGDLYWIKRDFIEQFRPAPDSE